MPGRSLKVDRFRSLKVLDTNKASARLKAMTTTLLSKSKLYSCGRIYILRLHDFDSWQSQSQLAELFLWKCNATSKYNANTSDLSGAFERWPCGFFT